MFSAVEAKKISDISAEESAIRRIEWTARDEHQLNKYFKKIMRCAQKGHTIFITYDIRKNVKKRLESLGYEVTYRGENSFTCCDEFRATWVEISWKNMKKEI